MVNLLLCGPSAERPKPNYARTLDPAKVPTPARTVVTSDDVYERPVANQQGAMVGGKGLFETAENAAVWGFFGACGARMFSCLCPR